MSLEVKLKKQLGNFLLDVDFSVPDGSATGLLGASGCGKSVTLRCIAGIIRPDEGRIVLNGRTLFDSERRINFGAAETVCGVSFSELRPFSQYERRAEYCLRTGKREEFGGAKKSGFRHDCQNAA